MPLVVSGVEDFVKFSTARSCNAARLIQFFDKAVPKKFKLDESLLFFAFQIKLSFLTSCAPAAS